MDIITDFYLNSSSSGILGVIGSSIKMTFLFLLAMIVIGMIASAIEHITNVIISMVLGGAFALVFCNYLTIPGTILHELSHAIVATITGARVTEISFFDIGLSLGHVSYRNRGPKFLRALQDSLTACAPVIGGVFALAFLWEKLTYQDHGLAATMGLIYLIVSVIDHMTMSIPDVINYFKGIWASAIVVFLINIVIFIAIL